MTIGNLPKEIRRKPSRRGQVLLGYLPTTNLQHITNKAGRRRALANLFHSCMRKILEPLEVPGEHGVEMASGDGKLRRCHPIFAVFIGDYPEQSLVACTKNNQCPKCPIRRDKLGDDNCPPLRDITEILDTLDSFDPDNPTAYRKNCKDAGIKPVHQPFWQDLPYVHIYRSITSDVLHQLYQGIIKHLLSWLKKAYDPDEIDARCRRLPPNHHLRHFSKGITSLSRISGKEHSDMCRILLGLIVGMELPNGQSPARLLRCIRTLLDFLYIAQFPSHTTETLAHLQDALTTFHANKSIFVDLGIRSNFNIPKLHALQHYVSCIKLFGTMDNYNTEYTERLHIDLAKEAYRATNHKDEYPQMTLWLERKEKVLRHQLYIDWRILGKQPPPLEPPHPELHSHIKMAKWPTIGGVHMNTLVSDYGAIDFQQALSVFIADYNTPGLSRAALLNATYQVLLPFQHLPVFHKIKFWNEDALGRSNASDTRDAAYCRPRKKGKSGWIPARFDTVLIDIDSEEMSGVAGKLILFSVSIVF